MRYRTLLEQKIRERRLTLEEFVEFAEVFAREHDEPGTLSHRHLRRLVAGHGENGVPVGQPRAATARLLERIFGVGIDELLAPPPDRPAAHEVRDQRVRRARVGRSGIAEALRRHYGVDTYRFQCAGAELVTSIVGEPGWLDLGCLLAPGGEGLRLIPSAARESERLEDAREPGVRLADAPLYRLLDVNPQPSRITGTLALASFVDYALTADLLEGELLDALAAGERGDLPLRESLLPDVESVFDLPNRLCAGGALALCAIGRPRSGKRGPDYALLIQQRSDQVLNMARRLSVIPKAFHQPLRDPSGDVSIRATLLREMEEELFGRVEVDSTGVQRVAAPMHPGRLSEPMRWLLDEPDRLRIECTGFGLNLVSGNYEFASLIVIDDEEFWARYGGHIEANWEAVGLTVYSSLDYELNAELVTDERWSNEGLFALLQGFRRLSEIGGERVRLPDVTPLTATERSSRRSRRALPRSDRSQGPTSRSRPAG